MLYSESVTGHCVSPFSANLNLPHIDMLCMCVCVCVTLTCGLVTCVTVTVGNRDDMLWQSKVQLKPRYQAERQPLI